MPGFGGDAFMGIAASLCPWPFLNTCSVAFKTRTNDTLLWRSLSFLVCARGILPVFARASPCVGCFGSGGHPSWPAARRRSTCGCCGYWHSAAPKLACPPPRHDCKPERGFLLFLCTFFFRGNEIEISGGEARSGPSLLMHSSLFSLEQ